MAHRTHPPSPAGYPEPFVAAVLGDALAHDARVYAIAGLQGTGKSTLSAQVAALARTGREAPLALFVAATLTFACGLALLTGHRRARRR